MICKNSIEKENFYPLTHPQKRIWYIEKIYPSTSLYNIGGPVRIKGEVNIKLLEKSINLFIEKNEGVRLRLREQDGEVVQYVSEYQEYQMDYFNFHHLQKPEEAFLEWVAQEAGKPFELLDNDLFYFALFELSNNDMGFLIKFHHIIADGWSINILTGQIYDTYMQFLQGWEISKEVNYSYIDYIEQEQEYLRSDKFLKNKDFWLDKFKVFPDFSLHRSADEITGNRRTFTIDEEVSVQIKDLVQTNRWSLNTFFVTILLIYIQKTTLQDDIVIGTPVLNRAGKKERSIFGMFTSTMPFRFTLDNSSTVLQVMKTVNSEFINSYFNQKYPYDILVQDLELKKKGYDNLFNIAVNYYNTRHKTELNGIPIENTEFYNGYQIFSLQLVVKDWSNSGSLTLDYDYKIKDYTIDEIERIHLSLIKITKEILNNPDITINRMSLLTEREENWLINEFNSTEAEYPKEKSVVQLFEEQVERTPMAIALCFEDKTLTYRELNQRANQLSRILLQKSVQEETIVGLLTTHSIETIIGIFAIIKAGGAYLPINPKDPLDRINYVLEDSGTKLLLVNNDFDSFINFHGEVIRLNDPNIFYGDFSNLPVLCKPDGLVYIIYTSGSTGKPKGTLIEHGGLVNYIWWAKKMYVESENEVFALYSSLAFDLTVTSIFTPLISGNQIWIYQDEEDEYVLYRIMREKKATVIKLTPSHLSLLVELDNTNSSVKRFIVGGENLKVSLARSIYESFNGQITIFNEYGPTETVVGCMIHRYDYEHDQDTSVPIGKPADNVQIYLLDSNLAPVPIGTTGELYISGDGVARGYQNKSGITKERFIANPFQAGQRMYKTGDLAKFIKNGLIEYVGRLDHQVKIRGYRIELGEIERHLLDHPLVKEAIVIDRESTAGSKYLCAYLVMKATISSKELREYLLRFLPEYMVPVHFIILDFIPLTSNGKLDRELLPEPETKTKSLNCLSTKNQEIKVSKLIEVISQVLNLPSLSPSDNFYHLGGDSIKAIQIVSKLNGMGLKLKVKDILSHPIIQELALLVEESIISDQNICKGNLKGIPIVSWFFDQNFTNPNHYNQSILLELKQDCTSEELAHIIHKLIKHHDSLRINYNPEERVLFYNDDHVYKKFTIEEYDLSTLSKEEQTFQITQLGERLKSGFNIKDDLLIKGALFILGVDKKWLLISVHHLVIDGISWRIILEDMYTLLQGIESGQYPNLPVKTDSLQKWAEMLEEFSFSDAQQELSFWKNILCHDFTLSFPNMVEEGIGSQIHTMKVNLSKKETETLLKANLSYNTNPNDLLLAALVLTLGKVTGEEEIVVDLEGHGREELFDKLNITRTVGWFTTIYPVLIKISDNELGRVIKTVKETLRQIPNNGLGFGVLKYLAGNLEDKRSRDVRFNFLGEFDQGFNNEFFQLLNENTGLDQDLANFSCGIEINTLILGEQLHILLTYSNRFSQQMMNEFLELYLQNCRNIIEHCISKNQIEFTPSDFETLDLSQEELNILLGN